MAAASRSEEHTSELQSHVKLVCRLLLEKKKDEGFSRLSAWFEVRSENKEMLLRHWPVPEANIKDEFPPPQKSTLSFASFFFNDTATTEIYTLSLHDALPILRRACARRLRLRRLVRDLIARA